MHLKYKHETASADYQEQYPGAELFSEGFRSRTMARCVVTGGKARLLMPHWEPIWTPEYILDRTYELHRRGESVHMGAIHHNEPSLTTQAKKFFESWDDVLTRISLDPMVIRLAIAEDMWTKKMVIDELQRVHKAGLDMMRQSMPGGMYSSFCFAAVRLFGSWDGALRAAGFNPDWSKYGPPKVYDEKCRQKLLSAIRSAAGIEDLVRRNDAVKAMREEWRLVVDDLYGKGCWGHAAAEAGVRLELIQPLKGKYPTASHVVRGIRKRIRDGRPVNSAGLAKHDPDIQLLRKGREFFGSWAGALETAGLDAGEMRMKRDKQ